MSITKQFHPYNAKQLGLNPKSFIEVSSDFALDLPKGMTATIDTYNSDESCIRYQVEYDIALGKVDKSKYPNIKDIEHFSFFGVKEGEEMLWFSWRESDCLTASEVIEVSWQERLKQRASLKQKN